MPSIYVPNLGEKLHKLYESGRNPDITSHAALASYLGLKSKASISNWITGGGGCNENEVPSKHLSNICDAFLINQATLIGIDGDTKKTQSLGWFERQIFQLDTGWYHLLAMATESAEGLCMIRPSAGHLGLARGVYEPPDDYEIRGERFWLGEESRVRVKGPAGWSFVLLLKDPDGLICLRPSPRDLKNIIDDSASWFCIPRQDKKPFRITEPTGEHCFVAVLRQGHWGTAIYEELQAPYADRRFKAINCMVRVLKTLDAHQWVVYKKPFYVLDE